MPPSYLVQVLVGLFIIFVIIVFLQIGGLRINNRPAVKLSTRILIALFFPLLFALALFFGSLFLIIILAFAVAIILLGIIFFILNRVKKIVK